MHIRIDIEADELIDGLFIYIDENQKVAVYKTFRDLDDGRELDVTLETSFKCPSCESWVEAENWTEKYICKNCAWDSLETEAYGEILPDD